MNFDELIQAEEGRATNYRAQAKLASDPKTKAAWLRLALNARGRALELKVRRAKEAEAGNG
jgi:hypothetical protein